MAVFLDNLTAIIVGTTLLVALLFVQQRGQQRAVEASTRYQAQQLTGGFATTMERDVDNIRTRAQTDSAFAGGARTYRFSLRRAVGTDGETYTSQFTFPTLLEPALGLDSPVAIVAYHVEPSGEIARIGGTSHPLYRATRYVYERGGAIAPTGSLDGIVDFEVTAYDETGAPITDEATLDPTPPRVHLNLVTAVGLPTQSSGDQANTGFVASRHARTVRVAGANATGGTPPVDTSAPGGIPPLPGDGDYVAVVEATPPTGAPGTAPTDDGSDADDGAASESDPGSASNTGDDSGHNGDLIDDILNAVCRAVPSLCR